MGSIRAIIKLLIFSSFTDNEINRRRYDKSSISIRIWLWLSRSPRGAQKEKEDQMLGSQYLSYS